MIRQEIIAAEEVIPRPTVRRHDQIQIHRLYSEPTPSTGLAASAIDISNVRFKHTYIHTCIHTAKVLVNAYSYIKQIDCALQMSMKLRIKSCVEKDETLVHTERKSINLRLVGKLFQIHVPNTTTVILCTHDTKIGQSSLKVLKYTIMLLSKLTNIRNLSH